MRKLAAILIAILVTACGGSNDAPKKANIAAAADLPLSGDWLADRVDDETLAYTRIPSLFGLTSAPKDNAFGPALASDAYVDWFNRVTAGLDETIVKDIAEDNAIAAWLVRYQRSPLEIIVRPMPGSKVKAPVSILSINTSLREADGASEAINALLASAGGLPAITLDADGIAEVAGLPVPAAVSYETSGRILVAIGNGTTGAKLLKARDALAKSSDSNPMSTLVDRIDTSGQGLVSWINVEQALIAGQLLIPEQVFAQIREAGLEDAKAVAFGYGVADGKARMSFFADLPDTGGVRGLIPNVDNALDLPLTGDPTLALTLALPTVEEIRDMVAVGGDDALADMDAGLEEWRNTGGFDIEALYAQLDGEAILVSEPVGFYGALRIRDKTEFLRVLTEAASTLESPLVQKQINGVTIHYWKMPSLISMFGEEMMADQGTGPEQQLLSLYANNGTHLFWVFDGNYAVIADTPQLLIDRARRRSSTTLAAWLSEHQGQSLQHALFGMTGSMRGLPRTVYHSYLAFLPTLADFARLEADIWEIPTADDLGLADTGALGLSVVAEESVLGIEMAMEHSPFDVFAGGSFGTIAAVGVISAIAIPAYQDYTIRVQVSSGLSASAPFKTKVAEYYLENGAFPNATIAEELGQDIFAGFIDQILVQADTGVIVIYYGTDANMQIYGSYITLTPEVDPINGSITFRCEGGDMQQKYLPSVCRSPDPYSQTGWPGD
ncbi:MAG: pilin [Pseudomonadota bacterium]